jgi:hypothetical protein
VVADKGLEDYIQNLRIINSHEHLRSEEDRISTNPDPVLVFLSHYPWSDLSRLE